MRLTVTGKIIVCILIAGLCWGGIKLVKRFAPAGEQGVSVVPSHAELPPMDGASTLTPVSNAPVQMPGAGVANPQGPEVRMLIYAWNSQMGLMFANGGAVTHEGSAMAKHGVNLHIARQDDNGKLQEALVSFATQLSQGNPNPTNGAQFVAIMGDGSAAFLKGLNDALRRIGPGYTAKVVGSCGYSRGEDKFMGPAEWKANPSACKGGLCAGVIRDGDWNIAQKWLGDNGLKNNPNEKTYDPDALNWVNASDYLDAGEKYIAGYSEDRQEVRNGRPTGRTVHVTVNSVVTWTPGDVNVAQKRGGLTSIVSTREYSSQMPNVIIGIDKWMKDHRGTVEAMLQAIGEGGDAVRSSDAALQRAAEVSQEVYQEKGATPDYWAKYYRGAIEADRTGQQVPLGGSSANNLADMLLTFGLVPGSSNLYGATYKVFGDICVQQYPSLMSRYEPLDSILDTSYLRDIASHSQTQVARAAIKQAQPRYDATRQISTVVSRKAWRIHFESGRAAIQRDSLATLEKLQRDLLVASGTVVEVHGHTDNAGNPNANMQLSEARAFAVKQWLEHRSPVNFPQGRVRVFAHGQTNPVAPNTSEAGRAQNRRVEVVLGTTGH